MSIASPTDGSFLAPGTTSSPVCGEISIPGQGAEQVTPVILRGYVNGSQTAFSQTTVVVTGTDAFPFALPASAPLDDDDNTIFLTADPGPGSDSIEVRVAVATLVSAFPATGMTLQDGAAPPFAYGELTLTNHPGVVAMPVQIAVYLDEDEEPFGVADLVIEDSGSVKFLIPPPAELATGQHTMRLEVASGGAAETVAINQAETTAEYGIQGAIDDIEALLGQEPSEPDLSNLQDALADAELALGFVDDECWSSLVESLSSAVSSLEAVGGTADIVEALVEAGQMILAEAAALIACRVRERDEGGALVLESYAAALADQSAEDALVSLQVAADEHCAILARGPDFYVLDSAAMVVRQLDYYTFALRAEVELPEPHHFNGAKLVAPDGSDLVVLHGRFLENLLTLDFGQSPATLDTIAVGPYCLDLAAARDGSVFHLLDMEGNQFRIFDAELDEIDQVDINDESMPLMSVIADDGSFSITSEPIEDRIWITDWTADPPTISFVDSGASFPVLVAAASSSADAFLVVGAGATVARLDAEGDIVAESESYLGLGHMILSLDRLRVLIIIASDYAEGDVSMRLLDAITLDPSPGPTSHALEVMAVQDTVSHGDDAIILQGSSDAGTLTIFDLQSNLVLATLLIESGGVSAVAIRP